MTSLALVGPGAIGCTIAAWLARNPDHRVTLCARTAFAELVVQTPDGELRSTPALLTSPANATTAVDWVLVATKAYDVAGAAAWLKSPLVGPRTRVAVLQNGVEHRERFAGLVAPERLVPVMIDCPAERTAPGRVRQRGPAVMLVPDDAAGGAFTALFAGTPVSAKTTPDWRTAAWRKLCINAPGALSALTLIPAGIVHDPDAAALMRGIIREVVAVGRAEGAVLDDAIVEQVIAGCRAAPRDALNSLQADRLARRPMEFDARNGVVARLGKKHGIPTPLNEMAAVLLRSLETPPGGAAR